MSLKGMIQNVLLIGISLLSSMANSMEYLTKELSMEKTTQVAVLNSLNKTIRVDIVPEDPKGAQQLMSSSFYTAAGLFFVSIKPVTEAYVGTIIGYSTYKISICDAETMAVIAQGIIPEPRYIKRLKIVDKDGKVQVQIGYQNAIMAKAGQDTLKVSVLYNELKQKHPLWFSEADKLTPDYLPALKEFCGIYFSEPGYYEPQIRKMVRGEINNVDGVIARVMALGAISAYYNKVYKNIGNASIGDSGFLKLVIHPEAGKWRQEELHVDPRVYKIHLMPRDEDLISFYDRLVNFIFKNSDLRKNICYFKIMPFDSKYLQKKNLPRIVLYIFSQVEGDPGIQESKEKAQYVLDRLYAEFKDVPGAGEPEFNEQVTDLIFFAQGNRDDKGKSGWQYIFDENRIYFKPGYQGSTVDFRLRNPAHQ
jgi:hypothetical protein